MVFPVDSKRELVLPLLLTCADLLRNLDAFETKRNIRNARRKRTAFSSQHLLFKDYEENSISFLKITIGHKVAL